MSDFPSASPSPKRTMRSPSTRAPPDVAIDGVNDLAAMINYIAAPPAIFCWQYFFSNLNQFSIKTTKGPTETKTVPPAHEGRNKKLSYSSRSHVCSVTWLDFNPKVPFSNKVAVNQSRALYASWLFPFFHSSHINSEIPTLKVRGFINTFFAKETLLVKFPAYFS